MNVRYVPINKGNYSMDTAERQAEFDRKLGGAWPEGYAEYRRQWSQNPTRILRPRGWKDRKRLQPKRS